VDPYPQTDASQADASAATAPVNDDEINQTLAPYGEWTDVDGYGRVWRPNATVVGVDFTPYETAGSWVDTDAGWSFSCDWDWGWLPFHYGYWDWFDGYWGWVPGYTWGPAWVEWRYGGGYIGWRPLRPQTRDHRHPGRDHDAHWRFAASSDFGKPHIHAHVFNNLAEGLRVTSAVQHPPIQGTPVHASAIMHGRFTTSPAFRGRAIENRPAYHTQPRTDAYGHPVAGARPAYRPNEQPTWQNNRTWRQPTQPPQWRQPPTQTARPPTQPTQTWRQPTQPTQTWRQPTQPTQTWRQPTQPTQTWRQPSSPSWHQPSQPGTYRPASPPTYSAPSHSMPTQTYSPPSHSSSSSYSAPSHSSSSSSSSSSGGGGRHR
jgi:hypothetical protein